MAICSPLSKAPCARCKRVALWQQRGAPWCPPGQPHFAAPGAYRKGRIAPGKNAVFRSAIVSGGDQQVFQACVLSRRLIILPTYLLLWPAIVSVEARQVLQACV
eukprot:scaffold169892_cov18-Tisochrysis_lutea.AAC.1